MISYKPLSRCKAALHSFIGKVLATVVTSFYKSTTHDPPCQFTCVGCTCTFTLTHALTSGRDSMQTVMLSQRPNAKYYNNQGAVKLTP